MSVTLNFHVCHQNITRADSCVLVADSLNYAYAHFDFCSSDWDGLIKTAVFTRGQDTYEQILEDDQCLIPWEVLPDGKGIFTVSVFAGNRITTNVAKVKLDASGWSFALESSQPPTEGVYSQILTRLADVEDTVVESAESAAQSATSAAESAQSAEQSMEAARTAKSAAEEAAASVTQYSKTAESWAVGGTGTRTGEDTDNSKYYAEQAGAASQTAVSAGNTATDAAQTASAAASHAAGSAQTAAEGAQIVQELYDGAVSDITAAKTAAVGAIQTKGDQVLDSIPADYTELSGDVTQLKADLTTEATLRAYGEADVNVSWVTGGISGTGTNNDNYTLRIRTNDYYDFGDSEIVANSSISSLTFQLIFYKYNKSDRSFVESTTYPITIFPATIQTDGDYLYRLSWLDSRGTEQASASQIELKTESQIEYVPDVIATEISDTAKSYAVPVVNPEEYCFVCNHHDNFSREETGWEMGQNSGSSYDVNNYEYVTSSSYDDGFRVNNGLACPRNTSRTNAFSIRKLKASHTKDFMVEFSCPVYPNYNGIAWDIEDVNNFTALQIGRESSYILLDCYTVKEGSRGTQIFRKNVYNTNPEVVQVYFANGVASVYFDDQIIASFAVTPFTSKVGILAYKSFNLVMSFINMFDLSNHVVFNPNYILDRGITTVPTTTLSANANRYSLSDNPARWSNYAEHFTLESTDEMIYHGIRTERATESLVDTNLRTVRYEFDVMFPSGYGFDTAEANYHDSIFQFHDRESDLSARGDVCFYLAVIGDKLTVYMSSIHEALSENVVTQANFEPILTIAEDEWYHFEIYQRERYDENQHPFTQIKIDGVIVWESRKPNAYNDRRGSGLQYGIYKNNWDLITSMGRFFDNVKIVF